MPSNALNRLIYISRSTPEITAQFDAAVQDIVHVSQRNNAAVGVTGMLLASNGWFLQALEGRGARCPRLSPGSCAIPATRSSS
jgi:hypothetical protein